MKRILSIALAAIFTLSLVSACKKQVPDPDPSIEINTPTILVPAGENTATFTFVANNDWTVTSSDGWCRVSPSSGFASENAAAVTVTLEPNETGETRSATITIKAGGIEKQITVTQAPEELKPEDIVINYIWNSQDDTQINNRYIQSRYQAPYREGGAHSYYANVSVLFTRIYGVIPDLVIAPEDDAQGWVNQVYEIYYRDNNDTYDITFHVERNPSHEPRTGHVRIATRDGQYVSGLITIEQTGLPEHAVDLGLQCYWHEFNLGATAPEEYGDYYAWGELEPKTTYTWDTYNCNGGDRYSTYSGGYTYCLWDEDDAAVQRLNPNGGGRMDAYWQMPTTYDFEELIATQEHPETHKWEWKEIGGHNGWQITYLVNGNSIFLPAAGYIFESSDVNNVGTLGLYWSSYPVPYVPQMAYYLRFEPGPDGEVAVYDDGFRAAGKPIRPVTY